MTKKIIIDGCNGLDCLICNKTDCPNEIKEITIDGVNVAECEFLRKCEIPYSESCAIGNSLCCDVRNCYFKQLQRLKKENENYKREINDFFIIHNFLEQTDKYKQALEEIRKETHKLFYQQNPIYGYNNSNYFEFLAKFVMKKTNEVLDEK